MPISAEKLPSPPILEFKAVDTFYGELHVLKRVNYRVDEGGREPHRRFVHAQELGARHERARDRHHLLLTPRKRAGRLAKALLDAGE